MSNHLINIVKFPTDAQGNSFFCALSSALVTALGITEETPFYCAKNKLECVQCGSCGNKTNLQRFHGALYHDYQTLTGVSFGWAWPDDEDGDCQTIENAGPGWILPDAFIGQIMDYAGLCWMRLKKEAGKDALYKAIAASIDAGYPALLKLDRGPDWHVVTGYDDGVLYGLDLHEHYDPTLHPRVKPDRYTDEGLFELSGWYEPFKDAIILTDRRVPNATLRSILTCILRTLEHPAHTRLEADVMRRIGSITAENAQDTALWLKDLAGFPIEARWHAAEAFSTDCDMFGLLRLTDNAAVKEKLRQVFDLYLAEGVSETHGVCWKIWGLLGVGAQNGYSLAPDAASRVMEPENKTRLKKLFARVFENDRAAAQILGNALRCIP